MTPQIVLVLTILAGAVVLFVSERLRPDLVALLVLLALFLGGLLTVDQAFSGFSSPAVVTVWAMFILSGGLARTGVAALVGRQLLRLAGHGERRLILVVMIAVAALSPFMNNVALAALFLPVAMDLARRTGHAPSRLLIPLAFSTLLGGMISQVGTPPNILVSTMMGEAGLEPFQLFSYAPVGLAVTVVGIGFVGLAGYRMLPRRDVATIEAMHEAADLGELYDLRGRMQLLRIPVDSPLSGRSLADSRLGAALGLNVIAVLREGATELAPSARTMLRGGDRLLVEGRLRRLAALRGPGAALFEPQGLTVRQMAGLAIGGAAVRVTVESDLVGRTLPQCEFRSHHGVNVLAVVRGDTTITTDLNAVALRAGDVLVVQGPGDRVAALEGMAGFEQFRAVSESEMAHDYHVRNWLMALRIPQGSVLAGQTLAGSRIGDAFGLTVIGLVGQSGEHASLDPEHRFSAGDTLIVRGRPEDLEVLRGLQALEVEEGPLPALRDLESDSVGLAEVVLAPHTGLVGKNLRQIHFRDKFGLNVLAIWRQGVAQRSNIRGTALRFGDALLLYGPRNRLAVLGAEPDFLVLTEAAQVPLRLHKASRAALLLAAVVLAVIVLKVPIAAAALLGATAMVLCGCLNMEEAYRNIEWPAVFLIAGMLPLGLALDSTGAAQLLADRLVGLIGGLGPRAVLGGIYLLGALAAQVMPNSAVAVLMAPIAINTATTMSISPYPLLMAVALSASSNFLTPVGHPVNMLIMGPGGYRFGDYSRVGLPLLLLVLIVVLVVLPVVWPLAP